ncbi:MAG: GDSL-type esterase/lipase family protein [Dehalococcoidia bacterium]|nr:GDSL-type esterase/lipase family protein [Dehalococcoidia bacterium]
MGKLTGPPLAAFLFSALLVLLPRQPALAAEAPAYVALGDSLAFGVGATNPAKQGYVARTFEALRTGDRYRERGLTLLNLSAPGATSADVVLPGGQLERALQAIEDRQRDTTSADDNVEVISIDIGANDLLSLAAQDSPCITAAAGEACQQRLGEVLNALQRNVADVLSRLHRAAPAARIYVIDLYNPFSGTGDLRESLADVGVQQVNGVVRAATSDPDLGSQLVSVYSLFQGRGRQWVAADGLHPNDSGHAVIGEVLLAAIERRAVHIADELLALPTDPVSGSPGSGAQAAAAGADGADAWLVVVIAVPLAFLAGGLLSGAYFLARGRG